MRVMLDLETLSSQNNAAIVAIGAVGFDEQVSPHQQHKFYRVVTPVSAEKAGGHISASTFVWWCKQTDAARRLFSETGDHVMDLHAALHDLAAWCREMDLKELWGNGSDFDNVILANAFDACDLYRPWKHSQNRCYRTLKSLVSPERANELWTKHAAGTHHNALDDAVRQAHIACEIFADLRVGLHAPVAVAGK